MADKKSVTLAQLEIAKSYIDRKDAENIKSAEFVDDTLKFYASSDKSGEVVAEITLPEETFLDSSKTEFVSEFSWSITKYPKSTNPELDGKAVLVLAVKTGRTVRYSFISLDSVVARLVGGDTESMSASVVDDVVTFAVNVSEIADNRVVIKDDGLYVGTVDNTPTWMVSTDNEVSAMFSLSDAPVISADSLGAREVGDVVKIMENGVPTNFIVVHKGNPNPEMYDNSCDGVWLLRERGYKNIAWDSENNDYENSDIHAYLNEEYINLIGESVRRIIKIGKIPFQRGKGSDRQEISVKGNGLACSAFLLSASEVGLINSFYNDIGSKLSYFLEGDSNEIALNRRICYNNGSAAFWWSRTPSNSTRTSDCVIFIRPKGDCNIEPVTRSGTNFVRPAFTLPYTAKVNSDGLVTG